MEESESAKAIFLIRILIIAIESFYFLGGGRKPNKALSQTQGVVC
jgi:hypothetical protein